MNTLYFRVLTSLHTVGASHRIHCSCLRCNLKITHYQVCQGVCWHKFTVPIPVVLKNFKKNNILMKRILSQWFRFSSDSFIACPNRACYYKLRVCLCIYLSVYLSIYLFLTLSESQKPVSQSSRTFYRNSLKSFFSD